MVLEWVEKQDLLSSKRGSHIKVTTLLEDLMICAEIQMYVQSNKWAKDPAKLGQFLNNQFLPDELKKYCTHITKNEMPQGLK